MGDLLVLTKPLGTGFVTTAAKRQECPQPVLDRAIAQMIELNATGRDALRAAGGAHAVTDVTGYGLAGHALEMAEGAHLTFELDVSALPVIAGAEPLAVPRYFTRASKSNREFVRDRLRIEPGVDPTLLEFAFDAQTSGGLLIAVAPENRGPPALSAPGPRRLGRGRRRAGRRAGGSDRGGASLAKEHRAYQAGLKEARALYEEANAEKTPGVAPHPELRQRIAAIRERMGLKEEALAWHRMILSAQPGNVTSLEAVRRLEGS